MNMKRGEIMTNMDSYGNKKVFSTNLSNILSKKKIDSAKVCNDLEIPPSTFSDWINAKKYPRIDNIERLAKYFDIQKSDLIEDFTKSENTFGELSVLYDKVDRQNILSDSEKDVIKAVITNAINRYENSKKG